MGNFNRKRHSSKSGVSEIIGNLLILGITVTLFSSIMYFVASMPAPHENGFADFQPGTVTYSKDGSYAYINVTHKGGQELKDYSTGIYLMVNDTPQSPLKITSDPKFAADGTWSTGETWYHALSFPVGQNASKARISILIIDTVKNSELYSSTLAGGSLGSNSPPIIGARGTNPSPTYSGSNLVFYANVMDPDGNLKKNSIYLNVSSLTGLTPQLIQMTDSNNDGVYTCGPYPADINWNGIMVLVNATDEKGLTDVEPITLTILQSGGSGGTNYYGPFNNYSSYLINGTYPPDANGGESGGQTGTSGTTFYYVREYANPAVITRDFSGGEGVLIEVWSDSLRNLAIANTFYLIDPITGNYIVPPSSINAFGYGGIFGTFHKYTLNFSAPSNAMNYPFQIFLRDNVGTVVSISDYLNVGSVTYPLLLTYKLNPDTGLLERSGTFNHTDTVYLKIITKDTDSSIINVLTGDIEVADYTGRYVIKKLPPAANAYPAAPDYNAPLSSLFKTSVGAGSPNRVVDTLPSGVYTLEVVLRDAYQGWWLPRTNAYTLTLSEIADTGSPGTMEDYHSLSVQFNVTAPLSTTDIVAAVGSGSFTWSSSGAAWDENSLVWFKGGERADQWTKTVIDDNTKNGPVGLALTDVDGDSYKDLIVGWQDQAVSVGWYKNMKVDGSEWSTVPYIIAPAFDAHGGTDRAGGTDRGMANEDVTVYADNWFTNEFQNDYYSINEIAGALATGDFDGYGDQEVAVSFVHPVVYTTATSSGSANSGNSFGMFFNRGIYVYWNIIQGGTSVTKVSLEGTLAYLAGSGDNGANGNNNPAAMDIQCADLNKDGYDDIVAVYQDGATKVWLNQYGKLTGNTTYRMQNAFSADSLISNLPSVPGREPWDDPSGQNGRVAKVRLMDMNKDGYPDIIRTSTVNQGSGGADSVIYVLYTRQSTNSNPQFPVVEAHTYGSAIGSFADLAVIDNLFENITETASTVSDTGSSSIAVLNTANANPANPIATAPYFNSGVYQVAKLGGMLDVNGFTLNSANSGNTVASAALSMKYIVWPPPAINTQNPNAESHSYGTATGGVGNLVVVDGNFEDLHEQTLITGTITGVAAKHVSDNTGQPLVNIQTENDTLWYQVVKQGTGTNQMQLTFSVDPSQSGKAVSSAILRLKFYTSNSYTGTNYLQWSTDGTTWNNIIRPTNAYQSANPYWGTYDLRANGVDTYAELNSLQIRFINGNTGSGTRTVFFDAIVEQAKFVNGNQLDWTWTINNDASYSTHELTINGYCQDNSEGFTIQYSTDNAIWNTLGLISSTTGQDYTWDLGSNAGSYYYVRVIDNNPSVTDTASSTFKANMVKIEHSGESGYSGTNTVEVSFDGGLSWVDSGVRPSASETSWVTTSVNLVALKGSTVTYNDLTNLRVRFINDDATPGGLVRSVWFDVLVEQVSFYDGMRADWTWTINNDVTYANHNLTVNAYCLNAGESFTIEYSMDNVNWNGQRTISSTTPQNYVWVLPEHAGSYYYVRIVDDNLLDQTPSTLCLNMIKLLHYPAEVNWPISDEKIVSVTIGAGEFITAIALGDIGKSWGDFKADTYPDIVLSTSKVGNGDTTHTLFVIMQASGGGGYEAATAVDTSLVAARVGNNNAIYDTKAIELGDFNGDKNLDIVLVIGFAPGRTGSGVPSLYIYANRPDLGAATFQEATVNALDISQSAINVQTGYIDLTILLPFLGVVGVIAGEAFVERRKRKK